MQQIRPIGSPPDAPFYSPDRDLSVILPKIVKTATKLLDPDQRYQDFVDFMDENGIDDSDLGDAAYKLAITINKFVEAGLSITLQEAMQQSGFADLPYPVNRVMMAAIGDITMALGFSFVREANSRHGAVAGAEDYAAALAAGELARHELADWPLPDVDRTKLHRLEASEERNKLAVQELTETVQRQAAEIADLQKQLASK